MKKIFTAFFIILIMTQGVNANLLVDTDKDGVPDQDELGIYKTDPNNQDTDGDGFSDFVELNYGFSPLEKRAVKLDEADFDKDGLSDRMEFNFGTDVKNPDSDFDGFKDGIEIKNGYSPLAPNGLKLDKRIEINTGKQELSYFLGGVRLGSFLISSGLANSTPKGYFKIYNKNPKAWSNYGLWMPWWMAISQSGLYGIHELPVWPNGYREGEDHLGRPASHGCVRLGVGSAEFLYNWTPVGTPVFVY